MRCLDRDIDGIVVPHVETVEQLQSIGEVVAYVTKGMATRTFSIAQIESQAAVDNVAADKSIDGFLVGPNDLAHSVGFARDTRWPGLMKAIDGVVVTLREHGRAWGIPGLPDSAQRWSQRGVQLLYCTREQILRDGYNGFAAGTDCS